MTWEDRAPSGGRERSFLIDEVTGDWRIRDGRFVFDSTPVSQVLHAVATEIGSVAVDPEYGSRIHEDWKMAAVQFRALEASIATAVDPYIKSGAVKKGSLNVEVSAQGSYVVAVRVDFTDGGGERRTLNIPIQPGYTE
jgi:hypothetical protein